MKVFISWSGERSRRVAELLHTWIECVIQAVEPWVSSSDIDRGALWFTQIIDELRTTTHGIICLTRENKEKPWILFEAGALAKGLSSSRIYTLLVDLNPEDIHDPLAQFNHTRPTEGEIFKLISSINRGLESRGLKEGILASAFSTYWPQFQESFNKIIAETEGSTAPKVERTQDDILSEILNSVRGIDRRVRTLETTNQVQRHNTTSLIDDELDMPDFADVVPVEDLVRSMMLKNIPYKEIRNALRGTYSISNMQFEDIVKKIIKGDA